MTARSSDFRHLRPVSDEPDIDIRECRNCGALLSVDEVVVGY